MNRNLLLILAAVVISMITVTLCEAERIGQRMRPEPGEPRRPTRRVAPLPVCSNTHPADLMVEYLLDDPTDEWLEREFFPVMPGEALTITIPVRNEANCVTPSSGFKVQLKNVPSGQVIKTVHVNARLGKGASTDVKIQFEMPWENYDDNFVRIQYEVVSDFPDSEPWNNLEQVSIAQWRGAHLVPADVRVYECRVQHDAGEILHWYYLVKVKNVGLGKYCNDEGGYAEDPPPIRFYPRIWAVDRFGNQTYEVGNGRVNSENIIPDLEPGQSAWVIASHLSYLNAFVEPGEGGWRVAIEYGYGIPHPSLYSPLDCGNRYLTLFKDFRFPRPVPYSSQISYWNESHCRFPIGF